MTSHGRRVLLSLLAIPAMLSTLPLPVHAQGWIEPRPGPQPAGWGIEKLRTSVAVTVTGRIATVEVEEWFRNNGGGLGESDYVYPLPGEAVFSSYSLYQGDQELRGELMDAATARGIYERIVRARRDPALIELVGKGMLRARVFPFEAGQTRRITLRYTQVLERAGDALQFRYVGGGNTPGGQPQEGMARVRDAAPLTFNMRVEDGARFRDPFSPTHTLQVGRAGNRLTLRPRTELASDFAVLLPFAERPVGVSLVTHRPAGEDGWFMLTLSPGAVTEQSVPRDVSVVVDVSGSMSGEKMEQARGALRQLLGTLDDRDRLRLIAFSNAVRPWRDGWTSATGAEMERARTWVDALRADGGTNISGALEAAFAATSSAERLPIVIFLTDGQPTVGETQPQRIVAMTESQRGRARVFAFGVGYDVNTALLDGISEAARGSTQYVQPDEDVEQAVSLLAAKVRNPVLTDLALRTDAVRVSEIYPRDLPDLFAGEELVVFGRYSGSGEGAVTVTGRRGRQAERYDTDAVFAAQDARNDYIPRLWASRKLGDLDRRIRSAVADGASRQQVQPLVDELRETALQFGLLSEHTAYLVQEPGMVVANAVAAPAVGQAAVMRAERARLSLEVASVAQMEAAQDAAGGALGLDHIVVTGSGAADAATGAHGARRVMAGRTFMLRDSVWVDTRHDEAQRVVTIEPFSDAYFAVLRALPETALVLREAEAVLIAGESASIRVQRGGTKTLTAAEVRDLASRFRGR